MKQEMEIKELKKKTEADLHKLLNESRDKLRDVRFKDANKQLKDVRQIRALRVTIAQVLTLLNNKNLLRENQEKKSAEEKKAK